MATGLDRVGWGVRLGFGAGDFAQNLAYPAASMYLLFFYTEILGIAPSVAAAIFLVAQIIDFVWNPVVGAFVDRCAPRWGKYRTWLLAAGIPFVALSALCFWNPFGAGHDILKTVYASAAYIAFSMLFTLLNVAYNALGASLTRDTGEITILTAVRIFMADAACFAASAGLPLLVAALAGETNLPWRMALFMGLGILPSFVFMPLVPALRRSLGTKGLFRAAAPVAVSGMAALYVISRLGGAKTLSPTWIYAAQFVKASGIIVATGYMWALVPEVVEYSERITGRRISAVVNSIMGIFFRLGMAAGKVLPGVVLAWTGYVAGTSGDSTAAQPNVHTTDQNAWLAAMAIFAVVAVGCLVFSFSRTKERIAMDAATSSRVGLGEIWREFRRNRPLRILALFFALSFAMMSVGNSAGAYFMSGLEAQSPLAREGVRWLVCVIPAIFIFAASAVIARYADAVETNPPGACTK